MFWLPVLAIALLILWIAARALGFVLGVSLNLLWIAAVLLFVVWAIQSLRSPD
jgi:hypothetical protein